MGTLRFALCPLSPALSPLPVTTGPLRLALVLPGHLHVTISEASFSARTQRFCNEACVEDEMGRGKGSGLPGGHTGPEIGTRWEAWTVSE